MESLPDVKRSLDKRILGIEVIKNGKIFTEESQLRRRELASTIVLERDFEFDEVFKELARHLVEE